MLGDQPEIERFVVVLDGAQEDVAVQVAVTLLVLAVATLELVFDGLDLLWQQTDQVERESFLLRKRTAFVQ